MIVVLSSVHRYVGQNLRGHLAMKVQFEVGNEDYHPSNVLGEAGEVQIPMVYC